MKTAALIISVFTLVLLGSVSVVAQQTTGTPGSPEATTTINGKQLPPPDPKFGGVIKEEASESTPWWPPRVVAQGRAKRVAHHDG
jgi:hypothetical protein